MIYLDNAATTKPYDEVVTAVSNSMINNWGNASSLYDAGTNAAESVEKVRRMIANDIGCSPEEIVFTSGSSEANSTALNYAMHRRGRIFTTEAEHKSVQSCVNGYKRLHQIPLTTDGEIDFRYLEVVGETMTIDDMISLCIANSENGVIQPFEKIRNYVNPCGVLHLDATQYFPYYKINVKECGIDMMSVSAHKFHGPKGIGFLYVSKDLESFYPLIHGAQENHRRGGTTPTALIEGMGVAMTHPNFRNISEFKKIRLIFENQITSNIDGVRILNHDNVQRLENHVIVTVDGAKSSDIVTFASMYQLAISAGSACNSGNDTPSPALLACGLTKDEASSSVRITFGNHNTVEQADAAANILKMAIRMARGRRM